MNFWADLAADTERYHEIVDAGVNIRGNGYPREQCKNDWQRKGWDSTDRHIAEDRAYRSRREAGPRVLALLREAAEEEESEP